MPSTAKDDNGKHGSVPKRARGALPPYAGMSASPDELVAGWLSDMPAEQQSIWAGLTQAHRILARKRLSMVLSYEAGGARNASAFVNAEELSLARFHSILKAWRRDQSLLALVPQARRRAARAFEPPAGIEDAAAEAVRERSGDSAEAIAKALHDRFKRPSLSWTRRLVTRARAEFERHLAGGAGGFGGRIVVDSAALPLPIAQSDHELSLLDVEADADVECEWAVAAVAWDAATGWILGHALDRAPADMELHAAAAAVASRTLRGMASGTEVREAGSEPTIVTTIPSEQERDPVETLRLMRLLQSTGAKVIHSSRSPGAELMKAFAGRIGQLDLKPRFALDSFSGRTSRAEALTRSGRGPISLGDAVLVLDAEVTSHNGALSATGSAPAPAVPPSDVADRLDRVFGRYLVG